MSSGEGKEVESLADEAGMHADAGSATVPADEAAHVSGTVMRVGEGGWEEKDVPPDGARYASLAAVGGGGGGGGGGGAGGGAGGGGARVITVDVFDDAGRVENRFLVEVVDDLDRKLYLGGYRNKKSGIEYHHATTQTLGPRTSKWEGKPEKYSRETQTLRVVTRSQQTRRECATQMARPDLYLDTSRDVELRPRAYFSADEMLALKADKTQVLQNHWRGYCARKLAWQMRADLADATEKAIREEEEKTKEAEAKHQEEVRRRMHPRSAGDFEVLYNELEAWRAAETRRINSQGLPETERLEALAQLLHKETKLLQTIDRLKITATKENRERRIQETLALMTEPKKWEMADGSVATVHTPFTTRAKELSDLYNGLGMSLTVDERLEVLLHVKWTVKQFDCALTRDICELVDREADLLNRGRSEKSLDGLRKRISNMFLHFIETPEFNPEAARFKKVRAIAPVR